MKLSTKLQLANLSVKLLLTAATVFLFSLILLILYTFLHRYIAGELGEILLAILLISGSAVMVSGILYIGLSLNIPTEHRFKDSEVSQPKSKKIRNVLISVALLGILVATVVISFTCISKKNEQAKVESKVDMLVDTYKTLIEEFPLLYSDTVRVADIFSRINIINYQTDLSDIYLIFKADIDGVSSFVGLSSSGYYETITEISFRDYIYPCDMDCEYLANFFRGEKMQPFALFQFDSWYIYRPFESHGQRFVLRFSGN